MNPHDEIEALERGFATGLLYSDEAVKARDSIHEFAMKVARVGFVKGCEFWGGKGHADSFIGACNLFPLPPRKVLREEPLPGTEWPRFRVAGGVPEVQLCDGACWCRAVIHHNDFSLMRHVLDLHDNPFKEVAQ
jgi:hypothetical protein